MNEGPSSSQVINSAGLNHFANAKFTANGILTRKRVPGKFGNAINRPGAATSDGITFSAEATGTTFTFSTWVNLTSIGTDYQNLLASGPILGFWTRLGKINYFYTSDHLSTTAVATGVWVNWTVVNNAGSVTFYLNGSPDGTVAGAPTFNADGMLCDSGGGEQLTGTVSHQYFWNRALSSQEVQQLYREPFVMFATPKSFFVQPAATAPSMMRTFGLEY